MALRRLGQENHRHLSAGHTAPHAMMSEATDLTQCQSPAVQSYHSAVHFDINRSADVDSAMPRPADWASPYSSWTAGAPEAAETSRQSQELLHEMRRLRLQMS